MRIFPRSLAFCFSAYSHVLKNPYSGLFGRVMLRFELRLEAVAPSSWVAVTVPEKVMLLFNSKLQNQSLKNLSFTDFLLAICLFLPLALIWLVYRRQLEANAMAGSEKAIKEKEIEKLSSDLSQTVRELTTKALLINQKNGLLLKLIQSWIPLMRIRQDRQIESAGCSMN
jgi:hypothetical protein